MKKFKFLLILSLLFIGINTINAFDNTTKVYDYAMVLTTSEKQELKEKVYEYIDKYNMDMVLVTVKYHEKNSTKQYAEDFYDYNGFGLNDTYDGLIFVIDFTFGYTDIYIATTGKSILMYDDYRINNMLDNIALQKNNGYYSMFESFISDASKYASLGIPSSNSISTYVGTSGDLIYKETMPWVTIILVSLLIPTLIILIFIFKNRMVRKSMNARYYLKEGSVVITSRNDRFITTHTTSVRINDSSSSSGGSRIGGSSVSRGSSGRSHGGGGRRL